MAEFSYQPNEDDPTLTGDLGLLKEANECRKQSEELLSKWLTETKESYDFVSGHQWADDDLNILKDQLRPPVTFNRTEPIIDAVSGSEVNNRQEVRYIPRTIDDTGVNDASTEAARWVRDQCDAEDEESDAFRDAVICGLGWTNTRVDYEDDLDGQILIERVDPLEMRYDPAAKKRNLSDARWLMRLKRMDIKDVKAMWPEKAEMINPRGPWEKADGVGFQSNANSPDEYREAGEDEWNDHPNPDKVLVIEYQRWVREPVYRVASGDNIVEFDSKRFDRIKDKLDETGIRYLKQTKRVYRRAFLCGDVVLEDSLAPCDTDFTYKCITGKRDRNKNTWYGLMRQMKDPQRWANKFYSQILHIINTNAKGGVLAEEDAFENPRQAEKDWARADSIVYTTKGAIARGAIIPKPQAPYPTGLDRLMELAMQAPYSTTGVNLETLGLADRNQPGVLEYQRRQAGLTTLAGLFDSLRKYRKSQGRVLHYFIREYISDGRLIRVLGQEGAKYVPLMKQPETMKYDIIVDEAASAPNVKERTFQLLTQILPYTVKAGIPIPKDILDYTPLPMSLIEKWKEQLQQGGQIPEEVQKELQKLKQENMMLKSNQQLKMMEFQRDSQMEQMEFAQDVKETEAELALKGYKVERELDIAEKKAKGEVEVAKKAAANRKPSN